MSEHSDTTVILANGAFPMAPQPLSILHDAARVICCDGAALPYLQSGGVPTAVIGDLDSMPDELKERLGTLIVHVTEQETNDLNKAFRYCMEKGWTSIVILGATGRREDHTLGNISLLGDFARQCPGIRMVTDDGEFTVMMRSGVCASRPGMQVSLFALDADTPLYSDGLRFPMAGLAPKRWWQATLNESLGESFRLSFPEGRTVLVYRSFSH